MRQDTMVDRSAVESAVAMSARQRVRMPPTPSPHAGRICQPTWPRFGARRSLGKRTLFRKRRHVREIDACHGKLREQGKLLVGDV